MGRKNLIFLGGLVLLNLILVVAVGQVWFGGEEAPGETRGRGQLALPKLKPLKHQEPMEGFKVVVAKDLFDPQRKGTESAGGPAKPATLEDSQLLGTIIIGAERAALLAQGPKGRQKIQVVRKGEEWRGNHLVEITSDEVVFEGKEGKRTLTFPRGK
jgi:hypothetical protein